MLYFWPNHLYLSSFNTKTSLQFSILCRDFLLSIGSGGAILDCQETITRLQRLQDYTLLHYKNASLLP